MTNKERAIKKNYNIRGLQKFIIEGTKEYVEKDGFVTIEISTRKSKIKKLFRWMNNHVEVPLGFWVAFKCKTCEGYHGKNYVHLEIEKLKYFKRTTSSKNFILATRGKNFKFSLKAFCEI